MHSMYSRITLVSCVVVCLAGVASSQATDEPEVRRTSAQSIGASGPFFSFGLQGSLSDEQDFGVGGRLVIHPDRHTGLEFVTSFDYYFPQDDEWADYSYYEGGVATVFRLRDQEDSLRPYVGLGLSFGHSKSKLHLGSYGISDEVYSSTNADWNLTAGLLFGTGKRKYFIETRSSLENDRAVMVSAGVRFGGEPQPKIRRSAARPEPENDGIEPASAGNGEQAPSGVGARTACPARDVGIRVETDKGSHPTPEPKEGKALVYVLRPAFVGFKIQTKLAVDGEWVGANRGRNYFFLDLDPGEHHFCSKAENRSSLALRLEAGKTYFIEQKIGMGLMKARNKLVLLSEGDGREKLAECHLAVSALKE